jgi:arginyl-tRNA synthetase
VTREYYINDYGGQIKRLGESVARRVLQDQGEKVDYPEDMYQGDYIKDVGAAIAERLREEDGKELELSDLEDEKVLAMLGKEAADRMLGGIKETVENDLKIHFDVWTSESGLREGGAIDKVMSKFKKLKVLYEKDGATYLRLGTKRSDEDPVVVKKDGEYTYIVPDLAYHMDKFERKFDMLLTYMGADHLTHSDRMRKALGLLDCDTEKLKFSVAQWMRMVSGGKAVKLSKRKGNIYEPKDLIEEVGYDAARFFMITHALNTHMDFDLDLAKERSEKNPVYYVQYAYVRLQSILRQAKERGVIDNIGDDVKLSSSAPLTHSAEVTLMRELYRLQEVVADIADSMEVQALPFYARDLARAIHSFYRHVPVLTADQSAVLMGRLQLVLAARRVLGKTLDLLGISKPEVM